MKATNSGDRAAGVMRWFRRGGGDGGSGVEGGDPRDAADDGGHGAGEVREPEAIAPADVGTDAAGEDAPSKDAVDEDTHSKDADTANDALTANASRSIDALNAKLESVKKEYDGAVGSLLAAKGELAAKRRESTVANAACEKLKKRADELDAQIKESELQYAEVRSNLRSREDASSELARVNTELDSRQRALEELNSKIAEAASELDGIAQRRKDAEAELKKFGELLQKTRSMIKESNMASQAKPGGGADVMRAASSMVASLNDRIDTADKEIATLRALLEKERREHTKSKKRLKELAHDDDAD